MKTVWFWKGPKLNDKWFTVANYANDEHEKPSTVESSECPTDAKALSFIELVGDNIVVHLDDEQFDGSPDMWYLLEETSLPTEMVTLHGMASNTFPAGTVVNVKVSKDLQINPSDRAGFVRWFRKDSRLQQVYTAEHWRRKRVSTVIIAVADIIIVSGEYGPYLTGGDITTNDGEELRKAWSHSSRLMKRSGSVEVNK